MHYGVLSNPRPVKRPMRCKIGTKVRIINIHPDDPHFPGHEYIDQFALIAPSENMVARTENESLNPIRRTFVSCRLRMLTDGRFVDFEAVRFIRASIHVSQIYRNMKHGKDALERCVNR
jgi:hypothetical protein